MFNLLGLLATGAATGVVFDLISHAPSAQIYEKHDHDKHHHEKHHKDQTNKQNVCNQDYQLGYHYAQKYSCCPV